MRVWMADLFCEALWDVERQEKNCRSFFIYYVTNHQLCHDFWWNWIKYFTGFPAALPQLSVIHSFPDGQTVMIVAKVTIVNSNCCWLVSCKTSWLCLDRTGSSQHQGSVGVYNTIPQALDHWEVGFFSGLGQGDPTGSADEVWCPNAHQSWPIKYWIGAQQPLQTWWQRRRNWRGHWHGRQRREKRECDLEKGLARLSSWLTFSDWWELCEMRGWNTVTELALFLLSKY